MDIPVDQPLPVGFFKKKERRFKIWIQFKLDWLLDFCYRCDMLDHVTGGGKFSEPSLITTMNKITTRLYDLWLSAKIPSGPDFATPLVNVVQQ